MCPHFTVAYQRRLLECIRRFPSGTHRLVWRTAERLWICRQELVKRFGRCATAALNGLTHGTCVYLIKRQER